MTVGELAVLASLADPLDKYCYLRDLRDADSDAFFRLLVGHSELLLPIVYTPTVGDVAQQYHDLPTQPQGLYVTSDDAGRVATVLARWPTLSSVRVVVLTDGERILGLGDLGAGGLAISEGKILLYTVCAGVPPDWCLPLCLDVGTNNAALRDDPGYKGLRRHRLRGPTYDALVEELVTALKAACPSLVLQWEDFDASNAFRLLDTHRRRVCCFNDDIQGTASVAVAGLLSALRAAGVPPPEATLLFLGAGEAGTGIGQLWSMYLSERHGVPLAAARRRCLFVDSQGLVCASRPGKLAHHKQAFAHEGLTFVRDILGAVKQFKPHALVGVSAQAGAFDAAVLAAMAAHHARPIIMPLSNPTSKAECSALEAFTATRHRCLFASGSPFDPVPMPDGRLLTPSQANNAYIFPALGLGAVLSKAAWLPDDTFLVAAEVLASLVPEADLQRGVLFPPLSRVRDISARVAAAVAAHAVADGRGVAPLGVAAAGGWEAYVRAQMWSPKSLRVDAKL